VPDLLKYLVEFSRDYFKNFLAPLSSKLNVTAQNKGESSNIL